MGIKTENVILVCEYGGDELSVSIDDDGDAAFRIKEEDGSIRSVFVRPAEAKMFSDTILKEIAGRY